MSLHRRNTLYAVVTAALATVCAYFDISLLPLIVALGILTLALLVLHLALLTYNDWLNRRREAKYPEWAAIRAGLEDIAAGRYREVTCVADIFDDEP